MAKSKSNSSKMKSKLSDASDMINRRSGFSPGPIILGLIILGAIVFLVWYFYDNIVPCSVHTPSECQKHSGCQVVAKAYKKDRKFVKGAYKMDKLTCVRAPGKRCIDFKGGVACHAAKPSDVWGAYGGEACRIDQISSVAEPVAPCVKPGTLTACTTGTAYTGWSAFAKAAFKSEQSTDQLARMSTIWATSMNACPSDCEAFPLREHRTPAAKDDLPSTLTDKVPFTKKTAHKQIDKLIGFIDAKGCQPYTKGTPTEPAALLATPCYFFSTKDTCEKAEVWRSSTSSATCTWDASRTRKCEAKNGISIVFKEGGADTDTRFNTTKPPAT
jgi:hypothetical protein